MIYEQSRTLLHVFVDGELDEQSRILLHAFVDGELDAGHTREIEAHVATCPRCASELRDQRVMRQALARPQMRYHAPEHLRRRIENALPAARPPVRQPNRRGLLKGFAMGSMMSAALAASLAVLVVRSEQDQFVVGDIVSAHLRSLQANHLIDVQSTDQHTVKPWFNGRIDVAPPVIDLGAEGFTLIGGRLDYLAGRPVATIVYKRRAHVIDLFVAQAQGSDGGAKIDQQLQGFNIWRWTWSGLAFSAVSDINPAELEEFGSKFQAAVVSGAN